MKPARSTETEPLFPGIADNVADLCPIAAAQWNEIFSIVSGESVEKYPYLNREHTHTEQPLCRSDVNDD